jgi:hypothetical protein
LFAKPFPIYLHLIKHVTILNVEFYNLPGGSKCPVTVSETRIVYVQHMDKPG